MTKTFLADVSLPANWMSVADGVTDVLHQLVDGHIKKNFLGLVVGCFQCKSLAEGMMCETGEHLIFARETYAVGKLFGRIFCTEHIYSLGRHIAHLVIEKTVEPAFQFLYTYLLGNGIAAQKLHLAAQNSHVDILLVLITVVGNYTILIYIMYQHGRHASHADGLGPFRKVVFYGLLLQHHSGNVSHRQVDRIALHDVLALHRGKHGVCPA